MKKEECSIHEATYESIVEIAELVAKEVKKNTDSIKSNTDCIQKLKLFFGVSLVVNTILLAILFIN